MSVFVGETTERASFSAKGRLKQQEAGSCSWYWPPAACRRMLCRLSGNFSYNGGNHAGGGL